MDLSYMYGIEDLVTEKYETIANAGHNYTTLAGLKWTTLTPGQVKTTFAEESGTKSPILFVKSKVFFLFKKTMANNK
jgi:hypothetical protein